MLDWIEIKEILRASQQLELLFVFPKSFLNHFCSVAGCVVLLSLQ